MRDTRPERERESRVESERRKSQVAASVRSSSASGCRAIMRAIIDYLTSWIISFTEYRLLIEHCRFVLVRL